MCCQGNGSGWQEVDRISDGHFTDVFGLKIEGFDALRDLLAEGCVVQFTGDEFTACYFAGGCNGELQYNLPLQGWILSEGAVVDAVDGTLVAVE
jgi:hypothetical protein